MTWTDTKTTGSTLTSTEYNNLVDYVRPTATATVAKSEPADYVTTNYGSDDACIQAAIDASPASSRIVSKGNFIFSNPLVFIKSMTWEHYGDITVTSGNCITIGSASTNPQGGSIKINGIVSGGNDASSAAIHQISGQYWLFRVTYIGLFERIWEWAPVAQASDKYYAGNRLYTDARAENEVLYIPTEPANVYIEGNELNTKGMCHSITSGVVLLEGGALNIVNGFVHGVAGVAEIDDITSRGKNIFILHYMLNPSSAKIHANSILINPSNTYFPTMNYDVQSFTNLLKNGDFGQWSEGVSSEPDSWIAAISPTISQESTIIKIHEYIDDMIPYSCHLTASGSTSRLAQQIQNYQQFKERYVSTGAWVNATNSDKAMLLIFDGIDTSYIKHSGGDVWEWLKIDHMLNSSSDRLEIRLYPDASGTNEDAYFDGVICVEGRNIPAFTPRPMIDDGHRIGNFTAPAIPATTVNYTNAYGYPCQVQVYGGTVTEIDIDDIATGLTSGIFMIPPGGTINITYSAAPSWRWWGL